MDPFVLWVSESVGADHNAAVCFFQIEPNSLIEGFWGDFPCWFLNVSLQMNTETMLLTNLNVLHRDRAVPLLHTLH